ncbi:MAG: hypothetical protein WBV55_10685 [Candidatus Sulfotelmatobacter sp.]
MSGSSREITRLAFFGKNSSVLNPFAVTMISEKYTTAYSMRRL